MNVHVRELAILSHVILLGMRWTMRVAGVSCMRLARFAFGYLAQVRLHISLSMLHAGLL